MRRALQESPNRPPIRGHWPGPLGLVAVEEAGLRGDRPGAYRRDGDGPLEDLRQVMVHGIPEERPDHRIVGAERRESLARAERERARDRRAAPSRSSAVSMSSCT